MDAEDWFSNSDDIIGRTTSVEDVIGALVGRGCPDLTPVIDLAKCSTLPLDGGGFCDVYRGSMIHSGQIAIKSLRLYDRPGKENEKEKILKRAARELYYWSKLKHCNVMPLVGLAMFRGQLSMISEWMENGNLRAYVGRNPSVDRVRLCLDVCDGLSYLHANDLVHGDLKAANVMVSRDGIAMIADFGNSQLRDLTLKFTGTTSSNLTIRWAAPELLHGETAAQLTKQADVYAYGMTALEILTGEVPFEEYSDQQVLVLVLIEHKTPDRPELGVNDEQWGILQDCWKRDRSQRPNIQDVGKRLVIQYCEPSMGDITRTPREYECPDLTSSIDLATCSDLSPLGRTYLEVYPGRTHQGTRIAIKVVRIYGRLAEEKGKETVFKRLARELYCFFKMEHPNILPLMGLAMFRGDVSTISEWMENGDLKSYISRNPDVDRISLCVDICMGLSYAHENKLVHGNLKAANVVVSSSGTAMIGDFWDSRIGDLGFKTQFTQSVNQSASARWVAPELMLAEDDPHVSKKSDVYAYGMTVLEILTGQVPFEGLNERRVLKAVVLQRQTPARPATGVSDEVWEILQRCWTWEPFERPEIAMVLQQLHRLPIPHLCTDKEAELLQP